MRLWHKDLISVLPRKQLIGQWRECCAIASSANHKRNLKSHSLTNPLFDYPLVHFLTYGVFIAGACVNAGYKIKDSTYQKFKDNLNAANGEEIPFNLVCNSELFEGWHNDRYLVQCLANLQEKYDCGIVSIDEWKNILKKIEKIYRKPLTFELT